MDPTAAPRGTPPPPVPPVPPAAIEPRLPRAPIVALHAVPPSVATGPPAPPGPLAPLAPTTPPSPPLVPRAPLASLAPATAFSATGPAAPVAPSAAVREALPLAPGAGPVGAGLAADEAGRRERLLRRAGEQRALVRWWAAECRQRNAACRRRFTAAHVAAATEARGTLRRYAAAWSETRRLLRAAEGPAPASPDPEINKL